MTAYLRPTAPIAADVLLPADPGLAMALAQRLIVKPLMANHHHGLWGYSGTTAEGGELTIQATGIGGPSAAAVLGELASHGARRLIRIGRCATLGNELEQGDPAVVTGALGDDGVSRALGATHAKPDAVLTRALAGAVDGPGILVASTDLPASAAGPELLASWERERVVAVDLESAALFALGERLELSLAAVVVVAESARRRADEDLLEASMLALGPACLTALFARDGAEPPAAR